MLISSGLITSIIDTSAEELWPPSFILVAAICECSSIIPDVICLLDASITEKLGGVLRFLPILIIFPLSIIISEFSIIPWSSLVQRVAFLKWIDLLLGIELIPNPTLGKVTSDTKGTSELSLFILLDWIFFSVSFFEILNKKGSLLKFIPLPLKLSVDVIFEEIWAKDNFPSILSNKVTLSQSSTNEVFDLISIESLSTVALGLNKLFEILTSYDLLFMLKT